MPEVLKGMVISNKQVAKNIYLLTLGLGKKVNPKPGQFFMLKVSQELNPLLPRPFSWFEISDSGREVKFLYQIVGRGTEILSQKKRGEPISLLGPLGKGFNLKPARGKVYLIAGGVGIAGLWALAKKLKEDKKLELEIFWGAKNRSCFFLLPSKSIKPVYASEDGSKGKKGLVSELFQRRLEGGESPDFFYACGPRGMLIALGLLAKKYNLKGEVLYEERMACGLGACMGCAVPSSKGGYLRVCQDGPVFNWEEIDWERVK